MRLPASRASVPRAGARVIVERLPDAPVQPLPHRATSGSACFDLRSAEAVTLRRGRVALVRTGLRMTAPKGTFLEVRPRSGLGTKGVLMVNAPGTIDRDYAGEVRVPLTYLFAGSYRIAVGDRIGQIRVVRDLPTRLVLGRVHDSASRQGGFGSTGR
jgi:dUTP pyrophosphatase